MRVLVQPWHTPAGDFSVIGCALGEQSHAGHALWVNQHAKFKESEANLVHHLARPASSSPVSHSTIFSSSYSSYWIYWWSNVIQWVLWHCQFWGTTTAVLRATQNIPEGPWRHGGCDVHQAALTRMNLSTTLAILSMHDQSISIMPASNSKPALFVQHGFVWCCLPFKDFLGKIAVRTHCHTTAISLSRVSTFHPPQFAAVVAVISFATLWSRAKHSKAGMHSLFLERIYESSMWENCSQFMHVFLHLPGKMSLGTDSEVVHTACSWGGCCLRRPMQDCDTLCCFCLLHCHFALQGSLWDKPMASDIQPGIETLGMPFCNPLHKPPWIFGSSCQLDSKHVMESNWVVHFYDGGKLMQRLWKSVVCLWRTDGGDAFLGQASTASKLRQNGGWVHDVHLRIWIL